MSEVGIKRLKKALKIVGWTLFSTLMVVLLAFGVAFAGIDPGRVAAIELASDQAKKTLKTQEKAQ